MTKPVNSQLVPLAVPFRGMTTRQPLARMSPEYCVWLKDLEIENGYLQTCKGFEDWKDLEDVWEDLTADETGYMGALGIARGLNAAQTRLLIWIFVSDASKPPPGYRIRLAEISKYDSTYTIYSDSGEVYDRVPTGRSAYCYYRGFIWIAIHNIGVIKFTPQTFSHFTISASDTRNIVVVTAYADRMWMVEHESASVWYSTVGAVTGALTQFNLSGYFNRGSYLACVFPITIGGGFEGVSAIVFLTAQGEGIVFRGRDPSGFTNWEQLATFEIGAPVGYQSIIEVDGDTWVITRSGIYSIRSVLSDLQATPVALTYEISSLWDELMLNIDRIYSSTTNNSDLRTAPRGGIQTVYDKDKRQVLFFIPGRLVPVLDGADVGFTAATSPGDALDTTLVADIKNDSISWSVRNYDWNITENSAPYYDFITNKVYCAKTPSFGTGKIYGTMYRTTAAEFKTFSNDNLKPRVISAPLLSKAKQQIKNLNILHTGTAATKTTVGLKLIEDAGRVTSSQTTNVGRVGVSRDLYNVGSVSNLVQYELNATHNSADTKPYKVVDVDMIVEQGGSI